MPWKVMVVDDEAAPLAYTARLVVETGLDVEVVKRARSGAEALEWLRGNECDIVLFDVMMPGMGGVELSGALAKALPKAKMIAVSGYDDYDYVRQILLNGASDYMLKHRLDVKSLEAALSNAISELGEERRGRAFSHAEREDLEALFGTRGSRQAVVEKLDGVFSRRGADDAARQSLAEALLGMLAGMKGAEMYEDELIMAAPELSALCRRRDWRGFAEAFADLVDSVGIWRWREQVYSQNVLKALRLIESNWAMNLTLEDAAGVVGVNATYLSGLFSKEVGSTFIEELNNFRVRQAKKLLREGKTVKEVAWECGFRNYSYMLKVFKKVSGMTTGEYVEKYNRIVASDGGEFVKIVRKSQKS